MNQRHEKLVASIRQHGQVNPILVTKRLKLIDGEQRLKALEALGKTQVFVRVNIDDSCRMVPICKIGGRN